MVSDKDRLPDTKLGYHLFVTLSIMCILSDVGDTAPPHMEELVAIHKRQQNTTRTIHHHLEVVCFCVLTSLSWWKLNRNHKNGLWQASLFLTSFQLRLVQLSQLVPFAYTGRASGLIPGLILQLCCFLLLDTCSCSGVSLESDGVPLSLGQGWE